MLVVDLERLFGALPYGVAYTKSGRIAWVNPEGARLFGLSVEESIGKPIDYGLTPESAARTRERNRLRLEGGSVPDRYEVDVARPDGTTARIEVEPRALGPDETVVCFHDVDERAREMELVRGVSELASELHRTRSVEAALTMASAGLVKLGFQFGVNRYRDGTLQLASLGPNAETRAALEALIGRPLEPAMPFGEFPMFREVLEQRRLVFVDDLPGLFGKPFSERYHVDPAAVREVFRKGNAEKAALFPLITRGELWGMAAVSANTLSSNDVAALALFALQLSSAIEAVETIEALEARTQQLAAIGAVVRAGAGASLDVLLSELARIAVEATRSEAAAIFLPDAARERLVIHGSHGYPATARAELGSLPIASTITGEVLRTRKMRSLSASANGEGCTSLPGVPGFTEMAVLPLAVQGRVIGTLNLRRKDGRRYLPAELDAADLLASQIAVHVENARLYAEAERRISVLSFLQELARGRSLELAAVVERILEQLPPAFAVEGAVLHLVEGRRLKMAGRLGQLLPEERNLDRLGRNLPLDETSMPGAAASRMQTVTFDRATFPPRSAKVAALLGSQVGMATPLVARDRLVGTLGVIRTTARPFDREELALFEACAAQVAIAIDDAKRFDDERRRVHELSALNALAAWFAQHLELEPLVEAAVDRISSLADVPVVVILLLDPTGQRLTFGASNLKGRGLEALTLGLDEPSIAATALREGRPVASEDLAADPRASMRTAERFGFGSALGIPLFAQGPVGVLTLLDTRPRHFGPDEVERAKAIGNHLAAAIANARMYESERLRVNELKRLQGELLERERLAALGELAAVIAHEVRNPLAVIFNSLSSLKKIRTHKGADAEMLLEIVGEEAVRLDSIVGDLLDFARPMDPQPRSEPLERLLAGAAEVASNAVQTTASVKIEIEPPPLAIVADGRLLRQAFINLMVNALQAMPGGGEVRVQARVDQERVRIDVSDRGPGISAELRARLFQPFFTTKATGTGLGLAVVKRIVEAHRGEIEVTSTAGEGATFSVRLPNPVVSGL